MLELINTLSTPERKLFYKAFLVSGYTDAEKFAQEINRIGKEKWLAEQEICGASKEPMELLQ